MGCVIIESKHRNQGSIFIARVNCLCMHIFHYSFLDLNASGMALHPGSLHSNFSWGIEKDAENRGGIVCIVTNAAACGSVRRQIGCKKKTRCVPGPSVRLMCEDGSVGCEAGREIFTVEPGDVEDGDFLRAFGLAGVGVGAAAEAFLVHLRDHRHDALRPFGGSLRQ